MLGKLCTNRKDTRRIIGTRIHSCKRLHSDWSKHTDPYPNHSTYTDTTNTTTTTQHTWTPFTTREEDTDKHRKKRRKKSCWMTFSPVHRVRTDLEKTTFHHHKENNSHGPRHTSIVTPAIHLPRITWDKLLSWSGFIDKKEGNPKKEKRHEMREAPYLYEEMEKRWTIVGRICIAESNRSNWNG